MLPVLCSLAFWLRAGRPCTPYIYPVVSAMQVTDVSEARDATGRNNSLLLSTPTGRVLYVADSETEQVEWVSALEGSLAKIMKQVRAAPAVPSCSAPIRVQVVPHLHELTRLCLF